MNWGQKIIDTITAAETKVITRLADLEGAVEEALTRLETLETAVKNLDNNWLNDEVEYNPAVKEVLDAAAQPLGDPMQEAFDILNSSHKIARKKINTQQAAEIIAAAPGIELTTRAGIQTASVYIGVLRRGKTRVNITYNNRLNTLMLTRTGPRATFHRASYQDLRDLGVPEEVLQAVRNKLVGAPTDFYPPQQEK